MKVYCVPFRIRVYCGGIWKLLDGSLHVPAESPDEAKKKISQSQLDVFQIFEPREIEF